MIAKELLIGQLHQIDHKFRVFGRTELRQLRRILEPGELIKQCVYGYYQGGSGLLVATDKRVLLIDKRMFYLYIEDHAYSSVSRIDFESRMLQGVLYFQAGVKKFVFTSVSDARLAKLRSYVEEKIATIDKPLAVSQIVGNSNRKPYLNPAWRPHHVTTLYRPRLSKYYTVSPAP